MGKSYFQQLIIDVDIQLKGNQIFNSNDISKTIDYALIESEIKMIALKHEHHLLEDFGEDIISRLKENFTLKKLY